MPHFFDGHVSHSKALTQILQTCRYKGKPFLLSVHVYTKRKEQLCSRNLSQFHVVSQCLCVAVVHRCTLDAFISQFFSPPPFFFSEMAKTLQGFDSSYQFYFIKQIPASAAVFALSTLSPIFFSVSLFVCFFFSFFHCSLRALVLVPDPHLTESATLWCKCQPLHAFFYKVTKEKRLKFIILTFFLNFAANVGEKHSFRFFPPQRLALRVRSQLVWTVKKKKR